MSKNKYYYCYGYKLHKEIMEDYPETYVCRGIDKDDNKFWLHEHDDYLEGVIDIFNAMHQINDE